MAAKQYKLESGVLIIPEDAENTMMMSIEASKAVSLKRIADLLDNVVKQPDRVEHQSIFGELFAHLNKG